MSEPSTLGPLCPVLSALWVSSASHPKAEASADRRRTGVVIMTELLLGSVQSFGKLV